MRKVIPLPTENVTMGDACLIVKYHLDDESFSHKMRALAIETVAEMETHNGITKDDLVNALRWLFAHYDFCE